ncbi:DUF4169 family protein [Sphingomonas sp. PB4P5]|uniref:DUF4169 family protein n=1 Tax=Parasphingomonas puruogangriensis TaxID=3096155 RepID=UPI002FC7E590
MAEIVNLRRVRKAKARNAAAVVADTNRAAFGRCKAEREASAQAVVRRERLLDGAKRED